MPLQLPQPYPLDWQGQPAHMSPWDFQLWRHYRKRLNDDITAVFYDVGLGGQIINDPYLSDEMKRDWMRLTQKRLDVLLQTPDQWIIIELRRNATSSALGRLLQYKTLWIQESTGHTVPLLRLVTNQPDRDLEYLCSLHDIAYIVLPMEL